MGRDKAGLPWNGTTMLADLVARYMAAFGAAAVSVDRMGRFETYGALELVDLNPGKGPLAGLEAAFEQSGAERVFLTATDLPYGSPELAKWLEGRLGEYDACLFRGAEGRLEPLFAVYHRRCLPRIKALLAEERLSLRGLLEQVPARIVEREELPDVPLEHILTNVNRPQDYERLLSGC